MDVLTLVKNVPPNSKRRLFADLKKGKEKAPSHPSRANIASLYAG